MGSLSKSEIRNKIDSFFQREEFSVEQLKKIRNLAMKHRIRLGTYRSRFCKRCYAQLRGVLRITRDHKTVTCARCDFKNKIRIS